MEAMKRSIDHQPADLESFTRHLLELDRSALPPNTDRSKIIFTGAGDSYSTAHFASEMSRGLSLAIDPYELFKKPQVAKGRLVVIVSATGKTKTNIALAKKINRFSTTLGITASLGSPLARACRQNIRLHFTPDSVLTSGTTSYTSSLVAVAYLLGNLPRRGLADTSNCLEKAWAWAETTMNKYPSVRGLSFVGSGLDYSLGLYGALKFNEVLGLSATVVHPEQFAHAFLFSIQKHDLTIFLDPERDQRTCEVCNASREIGLRTLELSSNTDEPVGLSIEIAFRLQCLAYALAKRLGRRECAFIIDRRRLAASSQLIY